METGNILRIAMQRRRNRLLDQLPVAHGSTATDMVGTSLGARSSDLRTRRPHHILRIPHHAALHSMPCLRISSTRLVRTTFLCLRAHTIPSRPRPCRSTTRRIITATKHRVRASSPATIPQITEALLCRCLPRLSLRYNLLQQPSSHTHMRLPPTLRHNRRLHSSNQ